MKTKCALVLAAVLLLPSVPMRPAADGPNDEAVRKSLVLVRISTAYYDAVAPWNREAGQTFMVAGLVLPGGRILVLASDIRTAAVVEVTKYTSYRRYSAKVKVMDLQANLAVVTVDDPTFFQDLTPLAAAVDDPVAGNELSAVKIDDVFRVYRETIRVTEVNPAAEYGITYTPVVVFRSTEPFRSGGVLLSGKSVAGFIGYTDSEKRGEAIVPSVLEGFQARAQNGYSGFVSQGFTTEILADPVLREHYGLTGDDRGPVVTRVIPGTSAFGVLKREDILLSVAGLPLDEVGYAALTDGTRIHALTIVAMDGKRVRMPGETIKVEVVRAGKKMMLDMKLRPYDGTAERIPSVFHGPPAYLVESGFVFLELSLPYMNQAFGSNWRTSAVEFAHIFDTARFYDTPGDDRVVILARILPDEVTRGYEQSGVERVRAVDGESVKNIKQLRDRLRGLIGQGKTHATLTLSGGKTTVMNLEDRAKVNARIRGRYGIPSDSCCDD